MNYPFKFVYLVYLFYYKIYNILKLFVIFKTSIICVKFYLRRRLEKHTIERSFIMVKRFFSALLAAIMCLSLSATAFAAEPDEGLAFFEQGGVVTLNEKGEGTVEIPVSSVDDSSIVPLGGGTETWSTVGGRVSVGSFTMEGNNLTPVKTIGVSGYNIGIYTQFSASQSVKVTTEIRKAYSSTVLSNGGSSSAAKSGNYLTGLAYVNKGDKIQIFFMVTDANGRYNDNLPCKITYSYQYVQRF